MTGVQTCALPICCEQPATLKSSSDPSDSMLGGSSFSSSQKLTSSSLNFCKFPKVGGSDSKPQPQRNMHSTASCDSMVSDTIFNVAHNLQKRTSILGGQIFPLIMIQFDRNHPTSEVAMMATAVFLGALSALQKMRHQSH